MPLAQAQELSDKLKQAGAAVKFITVDDVHTFQRPEARKRLAFESQAFFMQYLRRPMSDKTSYKMSDKLGNGRGAGPTPAAGFFCVLLKSR